MSAFSRRLKYTVIADAIDGLVNYTPVFDRKDRPPDLINFAGHKSFIEVGDLTVALMEEHAGLEIGQCVLDIGCAIGRIALGLHRRFGGHIEYDGFDIVPYGISWTQKHFAKLGIDYRFAHADIYNSFYNPRGKIKPSEFRFPYEDNTFDVSVATSVYTHMQQAEIANYLSETGRVTAAGGCIYATCFGLDEASRTLIQGGHSQFTFQYEGKGTLVESKSEPDMAVAIDLHWVHTHLTECGATDIMFLPGYWRGEAGPDFQDIIVAKF